MKRRIILNFADDPAGPLRLHIGDVLIIARKNEEGTLNIVQELQYLYDNQQGAPVIAPAPYDSLDEYIQEALTEGALTLEILAHSPYKSSHHVSSSLTKNCPIQSFTIDELTSWIESNILKKNITKTTLSLIICGAGAETPEFPSIAEQMLALFTEKPLKITARKGFVYMRNREKLFSLSAFDTLLHKAYLGKENPPNTFLEWFSFPVLRGLRTALIASKLHTYDNSTPLNEKFVYFKNSLNQTLKIDKHLFDLYYLSHPKLEKPLEQCTNEDFIKLANIGIQTNKKEKLYRKAEIVLKEPDAIHSAIVVQIDLKNYHKREQLFSKIDQLFEIIEETPSLQHAKKFIVLLNITESYINGRYFLNLPIRSVEYLLNILEKVIAQKGQFTEQDFQKIEEMAEYIKTDKNIALDAAEYVRLAGVLWPSDAIEALNECRQMNELFSNRLEAFCRIIKTENQLIENAKIHEIESGKSEHHSKVAKPEGNQKIQAETEQLCQFIHHQIQETSYLFSSNKFTKVQVDLLSFILQLIHATQKQDMRTHNELGSFIPLLMEAVKKLVSTDTKHPRLKLIEQMASDFVEKYSNKSENAAASAAIQIRGLSN